MKSLEKKALKDPYFALSLQISEVKISLSATQNFISSLISIGKYPY
jgi:hypothetical protein